MHGNIILLTECNYKYITEVKSTGLSPVGYFMWDSHAHINWRESAGQVESNQIEKL